MKEGQSVNDPRSIGLGFALLSFIAVVSGLYAEALKYCEQSLSVAITPLERIFASALKAGALLALGRIDEGTMLIEEFRRRCETDGFVVMLDNSVVTLGVSKILQGRIADGIHVIEKKF